MIFVDVLAPLQPLAINGREQRNRMLTNGPIAQHQLTSILPSVASFQSFSPLPTTANSIGNTTLITTKANMERKSMSVDDDEKDKLKRDIEELKIELQKSKETIARLQKSEEQMRER